ncbi:MAG: hypothetical protein J6V28_02765 [Tidjanibacter sp.]|nr:hypothetical protein [Tidjanibacter sp.]
MIRFRHILLALLLLATTTFGAQAQSGGLSLGVRGGHNVVFGSFSALHLRAIQRFADNLAVEAGVQYNTIGRTAVEARPSYSLEFAWGRVSAETLLAFANQTSINTLSAGVGAGLSTRWVGAKVGCYYRMFGGQGGQIVEPLNLYYEFSANLLPRREEWKLQLLATNCEMFELERHYQPTFIVECHHNPNSALGISFGLGCKPAGMFNLSADYYQSFAKMEVSYRW